MNNNDYYAFQMMMIMTYTRNNDHCYLRKYDDYHFEIMISL